MHKFLKHGNLLHDNMHPLEIGLLLEFYLHQLEKHTSSSILLQTLDISMTDLEHMGQQHLSSR